MSTTVAALIAALITTGLSSAVSHELTLLGGCAATVLFAAAALVSRKVQLLPVFLFGSIALSVLSLVSSEANTAGFSSTIHVLSCYVALIALAFSSPDLSTFCQRLIMANNVILTGWVLYQAQGVEALKAWQISNPSGAGNLMAAEINMTLPLVLARIHETRGPERLSYVALIIANCVAVFLVMSRNGIGSMLILLTLYLLFNHKRTAIGVMGMILGMFLFLDIIISLPAVQQLLVKLRFVGFQPQAPRSLIWQVSWEHIVNNPMLGVGPGEPQKLLAVLDICHAHNNFVQVAFESGIPAAAIFTLMIATLLWLPFRTLLRKREYFVHTLPIIAYFVFSLTAGPLVFPGATLLLAACVNLARVTIRQQDELALAERMQRRLPEVRRPARAA